MPLSQAAASGPNWGRDCLAERVERALLELLRRKHQQLRRGIQKVFWQPFAKPESRSQRISHCHGVDVRQLRTNASAERGVLVERECELDVARRDILTIVPLCAWVYVKRQT